MSAADNVTPIQTTPAGGGTPPAIPRRGGRGHSGPRPDLTFTSTEGEEHSLGVFQGLHGVCEALDELGNGQCDQDRYIRLAAAARVLVKLLDDRIS